MRIVCFHLNQVGDLIFSLPALKCLRDSFPGAHITSVVRPPAKEVLECTNLADEVVVRCEGLGLRKVVLARKLASANYDLAIVFSQSAECALLAYFTRAPNRVGFVNTSLGSLLTERVDFRHPPSTQNNLKLISTIGCKITKSDYVGLVRPSAAMAANAEKLLAEHGVVPGDKIVVLAPGTSGRRRLKEWTGSGFSEVARHANKLGFKVVIVGTATASRVIQESAQILNLSGKTSLGDVVGILARCDALVGVDSGILHLCAALPRPVVGLYGPSDPEVTGPQGSGHVVLTSGADCSPCGQAECKFNRKCMTDLHPQDVIAALDQVLG
ncbi:MAG: lipopolysaccharide heptosyltransferase II [Armatimonadetes bacterium]|nr:lipopolysaccharide heptosyltransferase II [Armatimonadota bacterium]